MGKDKNGFIFPAKLYVNYYWNIVDKFTFSGLLIRLPSNSSFILLDERGCIKEIS